MPRGDFFQIKKSVLPALIPLGLNATVAYLILARGSGRFNDSTRWSTNAIETKTGIGRTRARNAIAQLVQAGLLDRIKGGTRPKYSILHGQATTGLEPTFDNGFEWIWLPNSIVDGVGFEDPPLEKLRRNQCIDTLELFLGLYDLQNLAEAGGIHWSAICRKYERKRIWEHRQYVVWGFNEGTLSAKPIGPISTFIDKKGDWPEFWDAWDRFETLGLIECSTLLVESSSNEASIVYPLDGDRWPEIDEEARSLAADILEQSDNAWLHQKYEVVVAASKDYPAVELVDCYRLRYRAKTSLSASWVASAETYAAIAADFRQYRQSKFRSC